MQGSPTGGGSTCTQQHVSHMTHTAVAAGAHINAVRGSHISCTVCQCAITPAPQRVPACCARHARTSPCVHQRALSHQGHHPSNGLSPAVECLRPCVCSDAIPCCVQTLLAHTAPQYICVPLTCDLKSPTLVAPCLLLSLLLSGARMRLMWPKAGGVKPRASYTSSCVH
jgi:hypothetical protein